MFLEICNTLSPNFTNVTISCVCKNMFTIPQSLEQKKQNKFRDSGLVFKDKMKCK